MVQIDLGWRAPLCANSGTRAVTRGRVPSPIEQLSSVLPEVWKMIERVEGSSRWRTAARDLFEPPQLDELAIFDALADVSTFVEEVNLS